MYSWRISTPSHKIGEESWGSSNKNVFELVEFAYGEIKFY